MTHQHLIILGTHNRKKGLELAALLEPHNFVLSTLADFTNPLDVVENGETFADNARLKACQQARHLKHWVLGEDSGLAVDALGGAPGVFSARYSGAHASDASNIQRLLDNLRVVPLQRRRAHYVSHISLSDPAGVVRAEVEAHCHGRIALAPSGTAGFGYDPLFEILEYHRTFGQLGDVVKSMLSHRGRAVRKLVPIVIGLARDGAWRDRNG